MTTVIGIDPGTQRTGYGVLEDTTIEPPQTLSWGTITTQARESFPQKLDRIYRQVSHLCAQFSPQVLAVESLFFAQNVKSAMILSHVRGVILLAAAQANIEIVEYSPLEIKQAIVGYGRAEKTQIQHMITRLLRLPNLLKEKDAADALAVALCHLHTTRIRQQYLSQKNARYNA